MGTVRAGCAACSRAATGRWQTAVRRPRGSGGDHLRSHIGLYLAAVASFVRALGADGPPAVQRMEQGPGVGQAPPPGPRRTECTRQAGLVPLCDRLGEHAGPERGELTGPNPVHRVKKGSKIHLITERTGLPLSIGISGANMHDSQALEPLVRSIPPIRSRRGPRRRRPAKLQPTRATTTPTCDVGSVHAESPTESPAKASSPPSDSAGTAGQSNAPWPGLPAAVDCTATTNAKPTTSWPSPASPAPSSATADSPNEMTSNAAPVASPGRSRR